MVVEIVAGFVALVLLVLASAYLVSVYNQLVRLDKRATQAKQNIDVLLKQRRDELTKLIDVARETMDHEQEVLTELTEARERADQASTPKEQATANAAISEALATFKARAEAYPELRSQENMLQVQESISDVEDQIADRREVYNESVTTFNTRIEQFPYVLFARQLGYQERELFEASAEETKDVDVAAAFN
jgi:LemA protein